MDSKQAHFVELPTGREILWEKIAHFLRAWGVDSVGQGGSSEALTDTEAALGASLPLGLREFYSRFGMLAQAGFFNDQRNALLPPEECRFVSEFMGDLSCRTLIIGEECWGALWGIRNDMLQDPNPPIRCIDSSGSETDGLFSLTEFLVVLSFRAMVVNAPLSFAVEQDPLEQEGLAQEIHEELLANFPSWERDNLEKDCGFLSHIEGEEIIAAMSDESLTVGMKSANSINTLSGPLRNLMADLI